VVSRDVRGRRHDGIVTWAASTRQARGHAAAFEPVNLECGCGGGAAIRWDELWQDDSHTAGGQYGQCSGR
jgi:hypothetical protein